MATAHGLNIATGTIAQIVEAGSRSAPDLDVLTFEHEGASTVRTYRQLLDNGRRIAAGLAARGLKQGDRLALMLQNHPEFVESMVACAMLGIVLVPVDARTRGLRLAFMLRHCQCRGAIVGDYALDSVCDAASGATYLEWAIVVGADSDSGSATLPVGSISDWLEAPLTDRALVRQMPNAPMQILYTSGTTSDPKGVIIRHSRFAAIAENAAAVYGFRTDDRPYTGLSLTHANAQFCTLAPALKMGMRAVISRKFSKSRFWQIIRAHGCTVFSLLGGMATALYSEPPRPDDAHNPVRLITSAGMPAALWQEFERRFAVRIAEYYGTLEGGQTIKPVGVGPIGSCGRVAPGLIAKVVGDDGMEVAHGVPGEILFRPADGSLAKVEYFADPEASARKCEGGWLHTGDIVRMGPEGWVFFMHRKGGGIRRNGDFIDPASVERHLEVAQVFRTRR